MSVRIQIVPNLFEAKDRVDQAVAWSAGITIDELYPEGVSRVGMVCLRDDMRIGEQLWEYVRPGDGEELYFVCDVGGALLAIGSAAIVAAEGAVVAAAAGTAVAGAAASAAASAAFWAAAGTVALDLAIGIGVGIISDLVLGELMGAPDQQELISRSDPKIYTWDGVQTQSRVGAVIPVIYGNHPTGGFIMSLTRFSNIVPEGGYDPADWQTRSYHGDVLYLVLGLCEGEIGGTREIKINGNDITEYSAPAGPQTTVIVDTEHGTQDQEGLSNLPGGQTRNFFSTGFPLLNPSTVYGGEDENLWKTTSTTQAVDGFHVHVSLDRGLWIFEGQVQLPHGTQWSVRYRIEGTIEWSYWHEYYIPDLIGQPLGFESRITGLERAVYEIQVRRQTPTSANPTAVDAITWTGVTEVISHGFTYPNLAYIGLSIYATEELAQGGHPQVSTIVKRAIDVWNRDTGLWERSTTNAGDANDDQRRRNPAWIAIDILTNKRYGMGHTYDRDRDFDLYEWADFADWCDELVDDGRGGQHPRCQFDGAFEGNESPGDAVMRVLQTARAFPKLLGPKIGVNWARPTTRSKLFTGESIKAGSMSVKYLSKKRRYTKVEARFLNADAEYAIDIAPAVDTQGINAGIPLKSKTVDALGITDPQAARRFAQWRLNLIRYTSKMMQFTAPLKAITCNLGDVVGVANDQLKWGISSGSLLAGSTASTFVVGKRFDLPEGAYYVEVSHNDTDAQEMRKIVSAPGTYEAGDSLQVDIDFSQAPPIDSEYSIGQLNRTVTEWMMIGIKAKPENEFELYFVNYDPRIHDVVVGPEPTTPISYLPDPMATPPCLSSPVEVVEVLSGSDSGIRATWAYTVPEGIVVSRARVYYRRTDGALGWTLAGEVPYPVSSLLFGSGQIVAGHQYEVTVMQVAAGGSMKAVGSCGSTVLTPTGLEGSLLPAPLAFTASSLGDFVNLNWANVNDPALAHYEIRRGESWVLSQFLDTTIGNNYQTDQVAPTSSTSPSLAPQPGLERYWIRAVSSTGLYGIAATSELTSVFNWAGGAIAVDRSENLLGWPGTQANLIEVDGALKLDELDAQGSYVTDPILVAAGTYRIGGQIWGSIFGGTIMDEIHEFLDSTWGNRNSVAEGPIDPDDWIGSMKLEIKTAETEVGLAAALWQSLTTRNFPNVGAFQVRVTLSAGAPWGSQLNHLHLAAEAI